MEITGKGWSYCMEPNCNKRPRLSSLCPEHDCKALQAILPIGKNSPTYDAPVAKLTFTTALPTTPGYYWVKVQPSIYAMAVYPYNTIVKVDKLWDSPTGWKVHISETIGATIRLLNDPDFLAWAGPIPQPLEI